MTSQDVREQQKDDMGLQPDLDPVSRRLKMLQRENRKLTVQRDAMQSVIEELRSEPTRKLLVRWQRRADRAESAVHTALIELGEVGNRDGVVGDGDGTDPEQWPKWIDGTSRQNLADAYRMLREIEDADEEGSR